MFHRFLILLVTLLALAPRIAIANDVSELTAWVSGTSNPKVSGTNRLMTVMVMGESSGDLSATSVTYGGQTMDKRVERLFFVSGNRTYAAMFTLGEVGVNAATSGTIAVNWNTTPTSGSAIYSVLLSGVDQANPISSTQQNALSGTVISTSPLTAGGGDLVIMGGATENDTTLTFNNGFTKQFESNSSWGDATGGRKLGVGAAETPLFTQSPSGRMVLCAMVVKAVTAVQTFSLATTANNGTVVLNPPGGIYNEGTVVTLTATPSDGFKFFSWSGGYSGSVNPGSITVAADTSVTANFIVKPVYPQQFTYNGNPLVRNHGAADPDVHVWDGKVWMYCSQDHAPAPGGDTYSRMDGYHAFSSTNMIDWVDHGEVLHSRDVSWGVDGWMWAPGAAKANGQYYLYYPHKDQSGTWRIGVATSPVPQGPFTDIGAPMAGITGVDPAVFIDDDGQAYIYNNISIVAKLKPNMIELAEPTRKITYGPPEVMGDTDLQFNEGSYMHKRAGIYYYSFTNYKNRTHQSFYATGTSPYGPFEWRGAMAPKPVGAQDHHSIIEFQNQWYYFYHVAVPGYPLLKDGQSRIACYDKLFYNSDGTIRLVNMTMGQLGGAASAHVNCGGPAYTTSGGLEFEADGAYPSGGFTWSTTAAIAGTDDDTLYQTDRHGSSFQYNIPLADGTYEVTLMFAEIFFSANGKRVFNVSMEGNPVITGLDIHSMVGKNAAHDEKRVVTVSGGQLNIAFTSTVDKAKISAIRVAPLEHPLATTASAGQITLDPPGGSHVHGSVVTLTAVPEDGYRFIGWSGDLSGTTNPASLVMDGQKSVLAVFELMVPVLSARLDAADVVLSWPPGFTRWRLEWAETLGPDASWTEIPPDSYDTSDTGWFWREAASHDKRFFRLRFH